MSKNCKFRYILILFIAVILNIDTSCVRCGFNREKYRKESFKGIIIKSFRIEYNHDSPAVTIKENENEFDYVIDNYSDLYKFAEVGDSLIKLEDSLKITLIKKNGERKDFRFIYE
jgi:hypothetical protein